MLICLLTGGGYPIHSWTWVGGLPPSSPGPLPLISRMGYPPVWTWDGVSPSRPGMEYPLSGPRMGYPPLLSGPGMGYPLPLSRHGIGYPPPIEVWTDTVPLPILRMRVVIIRSRTEAIQWIDQGEWDFKALTEKQIIRINRPQGWNSWKWKQAHFCEL